MSRRLLNACVAAVLTLGGWAGALASVVCPHAGGGPRAAAREHACCRAKVRAKTQTPAQTSPVSTPHTPARHATRRSCHAKAPAAPAAGHRAAAAHDHATRQAAAPRVAAGQSQAAARPAKPCAHCVGRPELPPAAARARDGEGPRRETHAASGRATSPPRIVEPPRARAVAAARGAPPGTQRLYVLVSRFLI